MCSFSRSSSRSSVSVNSSPPPGPVVFCPARLVQFLIFSHRSKAISNQLPIAGKYFPFSVSALHFHPFLPPNNPSTTTTPSASALALRSALHHTSTAFALSVVSAIFPLFSLNPPLALHFTPPPQSAISLSLPFFHL